jgi:hypothetical protein
MDQSQLRAILRTLITDRAQAGKSLADVGRVLAQEISPTRPPFSRQYVHMLANGKARITEAIGAAIATLATMQAGVAGIQARVPMTFDPVSGESEIP